MTPVSYSGSMWLIREFFFEQLVEGSYPLPEIKEESTLKAQETSS
jgi:hypothetical protein